MDRNKAIMVCMTVGSVIGGLIPSLWSANMFSLWGVLFTAIGGAVGIWAGYTLNN